MDESMFTVATQEVPGERPHWKTRLARSSVLRRLCQLTEGSLEILENRERHQFGCSKADAPDVTLRINDSKFWNAIALGGSIGAGESYMAGDWSCDDLSALIRLFVRNRSALEGIESGWARWTAPVMRLGHALRANTRRGSRKNIAAHYDLGDDFFGLFLDETMMYSCAVFEHEGMTLAEASRAKLDRIARKLELSPSDHVLEIGTGWGGFAIHAARNYGCRVTTTTISRKQFEFTLRKVVQLGLGERVTVLLRDYRDLRGQFDKLVSIEMVEAVGAPYLEQYFNRCASLLRPEGMMLLQAIVIADQCYDAALRSVDFIQRHIFPGSFIPAISALCHAMKRATHFRLSHLEDIGPHYARTLGEWRRRFMNNLDAVRAQGFDERFIRMWEYYLCYCEGGFVERQLGTVQMLLAGPRCRRDGLPQFQSLGVSRAPAAIVPITLP